MPTTRFDILSLLFTGLALLGLPRLLRDWRALVAPSLSPEGKALAVYAAVFLAVPLATMAHECGHFVVARALGAADATLHYRVFWGFVEYRTRLPGHGDWWVALAGNAVSWALAALGLLAASSSGADQDAKQASAAAVTAAEGEAAADSPAPDEEGVSRSEAPASGAGARPGRGLPPGLRYAARTFGMLEMVHTLVAYPLMSLSDLPGADWSVIYGHPFWAGTYVVMAVHALSLFWLRRVLRSDWS